MKIIVKIKNKKINNKIIIMKKIKSIIIIMIMMTKINKQNEKTKKNKINIRKKKKYSIDEIAQYNIIMKIIIKQIIIKIN